MNDQVARRSRELFESGFYCAESVLLAVTEAKGVHSELIPKIATGFCSGMGRTGGQCGALSGAIMSISLFTGRSSPEESVDRTYHKVSRLKEIFADRFEHTTCIDLLKVDLNSEEGQKEFREKNLIENCYTFTEEATRIATSLIDEHE